MFLSWLDWLATAGNRLARRLNAFTHRQLLTGLILFFACWRFLTLDLIEKSGDAVWKWSFLRYYAVSGIWYPDTPDHHQGRWGLNLPVYALMKLFGTSWWVYYIYPLLTALGCAILAYWIAAKLRSKAAGVATFLLICFFPHTVRESTQFLPMMPATFYMLGAIVLLLRHLKTGALMPLFWSGLLAGISYGCKFTSLYWAAAFGLYLLLYPVEKREYFRVWKFHVGPAAFCFSAGLLLVLVLETVLLDAFFGVTGGRVEVILGSHLSHRVSPEYLGIGGYLLSFFRPLEFSGKYFQSGPAILLFCGVLLMAILQLKKGCPPGRRLLAFSFMTAYLLHCYVVYKVFPFLHPEKAHLRYFLLLAVVGILILTTGWDEAAAGLRRFLSRRKVLLLQTAYLSAIFVLMLIRVGNQWQHGNHPYGLFRMQKNFTAAQQQNLPVLNRIRDRRELRKNQLSTADYKYGTMFLTFWGAAEQLPQYNSRNPLLVEDAEGKIWEVLMRPEQLPVPGTPCKVLLLDQESSRIETREFQKRPRYLRLRDRDNAAS